MFRTTALTTHAAAGVSLVLADWSPWEGVVEFLRLLLLRGSGSSRACVVVRSRWAGPPLSSSRPAGSLSSEDHDFDPTAEALARGYDEDRALEEEEVMAGGKDFSAEIGDLEKVQGAAFTPAEAFELVVFSALLGDVFYRECR